MSFLNPTPFVQYDPATGAVMASGIMQEAAIVHLRLLDKPYLPGEGAPGTHRVNLATMTIEEIDATSSVTKEEQLAFDMGGTAS